MKKKYLVLLVVSFLSSVVFVQAAPSATVTSISVTEARAARFLTIGIRSIRRLLTEE